MPKLRAAMRKKPFIARGLLDKIDHIVERAIQYTLHVLDAAPEHRAAARVGLERMCSNLTIGAPDHPALERLQAFLSELDAGPKSRALH